MIPWECFMICISLIISTLERLNWIHKNAKRYGSKKAQFYRFCLNNFTENKCP